MYNQSCRGTVFSRTTNQLYLHFYNSDHVFYTLHVWIEHRKPKSRFVFRQIWAEHADRANEHHVFFILNVTLMWSLKRSLLALVKTLSIWMRFSRFSGINEHSKHMNYFCIRVVKDLIDIIKGEIIYAACSNARWIDGGRALQKMTKGIMNMSPSGQCLAVTFIASTASHINCIKACNWQS